MQQIIQEILDAGKYTEQDIANYVGISKETIRRIKTGKTQKPNYKISTAIFVLSLLLKLEISQDDT